MLQCNGLVAIPSEPKLQFVPWNDQGFFASFDVVSQEPIKDKGKGFHKIHYYHANMFVAKDRKSYWENLIKSGEVFLIRTADFSSIRPEGFNNPIPQLKLTEKNFLHLKQAQWHSA
ncbi:hypothetical protein CMI41_01170 [Candidatus Pacearchaeota archaeon]|nr:hypothetical protein [Candidatus Pacearchaeota archaeon]|tara:strand:- start:8009 stop:8356 length:348 start_codon:yes stop_codon:yes gene_type:complete